MSFSGLFALSEGVVKISVPSKDGREAVLNLVYAGEIFGEIALLDGRTRTRFAKGGGSYLSASDPRHVFGLGQAKQTGRLTVTWPSGEPRVQHWDNLAVDRYHRLVQGEK